MLHKLRQDCTVLVVEFHIPGQQPAQPRTADNAPTTDVGVCQNLWGQFHRLPNVYFLVLAILQCFKQISTTRGIPTIMMPLSCVLGITMLREGFEDWRRHKQETSSHPHAHTHSCVFLCVVRYM